MSVETILKAKGHDVVTTRADTPVAEAARILNEFRIGAVVVLDARGGVVGILSERDIVRGMATRGQAMADLKVEDLMTRDVLFCHPADSLDGLMSIMTNSRVRHLPVIEDGQLKGMISIGDVVKNRIEEQAMEVDSLRNYVMAGR